MTALLCRVNFFVRNFAKGKERAYSDKSCHFCKGNRFYVCAERATFLVLLDSVKSSLSIISN